MRMDSLSNHSKKLLVLAFAAFASAASAQNAVQEGRAYLMVEDFKTLLGAAPRDPSSKASITLAAAPSVQDGTDGGRAFQLRLGHGEISRLRKEVRAIEQQRDQLLARLNQETATKKADLRGKRREVQAARMSARSDADAALGKTLFESLLQEANLDAHLEREVAAFDEAHAIEIAFQEKEGMKLVSSIRISGDLVWSRAGTPTANIAAR